MKSKAIICAVTAACMGLSGLAMAQQDKDMRSDEANRASRMDQRGPDRDRRPMPMRDDHLRRGPGAGPEHSFYRGGRLPPQYHQRQYVVDDWRGHHLRQPPRGYHWVQSGGDFLLVAITTGIIADILLNH